MLASIADVFIKEIVRVKEIKEMNQKKEVTPFMEKCYKKLCTVPAGYVTTYGDLAKALHTSARAIGRAMNRNPFAPQVPCHRVVAFDGSLCGYASGLKKKAALLKAEGVVISKEGIVDLKEARWKF